MARRRRNNSSSARSKEKAGGGSLLWIIISLVVIAVAGAGWYFTQEKMKKAPAGKKAESVVGEKVGSKKTAAAVTSAKKKASSVVIVDPEEAVIVIAAADDYEGNVKPLMEKVYRRAAEELQKHLSLITGVEIPIAEKSSEKYAFNIGLTPVSDKKELAPQEACSFVSKKAAYFYADASLYNFGVEYAVYDFLEGQLGVTWIEPGDSGIVYKKQSKLKLKPGKYSWVPKLMFRKIRQAWRIRKEANPPVPKRLKKFPEFWPSDEVNNRKAEDDMAWQRRMKMGGGRPGGGHSFTKWWDKYGKTNPEYFALNRFGKREPVKDSRGAKETKEFIKICPSNPAVAEQIVKDWLPMKDRVKYVNAGMNDSVQNFCECENCKKLDVVLPGDEIKNRKPGSFASPGGEKYVHLTDRYVYLANAVAREVRKHRKDAMVAMYAYLTSIHPPRKLKVEPNVVVQFVPYVIPLDARITEEIIGGWYKAGAKHIAFRPNYHFKYHPFPMPIGVEKEMFDVFQVAVKNGCISADYDSLMGSWNLTGMADYILARTMSDPSKDFYYWEDKYLSAFGKASEDVKKYFRYWRHNIWEGRIRPNLKKLAKTGRSGNVARAIGWAISSNYIRNYKPEGCSQYYTEIDFDKTDKILQKALTRDLTETEKRRVNQLVLINTHSRYEHGAMYYRDDMGYGYAKDLLAFRKKHRTDLNMSWGGIFYVEDVWGDVCKLNLAVYLESYQLPWLKTPFKWRFKIDENNVGETEKWQEKDWDATKDWKSIRVNVPWSNTYESPHVELKKKLKDYDGIGWYTFRVKLPYQLQGKKVFLYFGGVDDNCKVYVNGKLAGEHISKTPADTNKPFEIQIDKFVDWVAEYQTATVRVEDKGGRGGVHKETWIVTK
ncbi:MAG: DUF4838 domain-containing protein [Planctomycetota bacterium]|jgi:hypothetical protein